VVTSTRSFCSTRLRASSNQIVDLAFERFDRDARIDQAGWPNDQFNHPAARHSISRGLGVR